ELDTLLNIPYGQALDYQGNMQTLLLDGFIPKSNLDSLSLRPIVVMIHGGGFVSGSKESRRQECVALAQRGFAAFSINYRLGFDPGGESLAVYRAQQDAHAAVRWVVDQSSSMGMDTSWLFIAGSSAGAITGHNLVYSDQSEWEQEYPGIESLLGSLDTSSNNLTNTFTFKGVFNNWGNVRIASVQTDELLPQVAFHGALDGTLNIDTLNGAMGSRALHDTLIANGICSDLTVEPLGGHGIYRSPQGAIMRAARASCFFKSLFCNNCTDYYATDSIPATCSILNSTPEIEAEIEMYSVYPNPFSGNFKIAGLHGDEDLMLYDVQGKMVGEGKNSTDLNTESLPKGLYMLAIRRGEKVQVVRVMKGF
ncbi:MAG: alpha/beta hydrolase fold domain-containing protein, partial [Bacteroidota bacterium]